MTVQVQKVNELNTENIIIFFLLEGNVMQFILKGFRFEISSVDTPCYTLHTFSFSSSTVGSTSDSCINNHYTQNPTKRTQNSKIHASGPK